MNYVLRFVPFLIGVVVVYVVATSIASLEKPYKLFIIFIVVLGLCYFFTWFNVWMMKRTGELVGKVLAPVSYGHMFTVLSSACFAYGFVENMKIIMAAGLVAMFYADILLTKTKIESTKFGDREKGQLFKKVLDEHKDRDPYVAVKVGSRELTQRILKSLENERGVHVESALGILGSLGGYSCHLAIRQELVDTGKLAEKDAFVIVECKSGRKYYFGDLPNRPLIADKLSLWALVKGVVEKLGVSSFPDVVSITKYVTSTVGGPNFGIPNVDDTHRPGDLPINYVKAMWSPLVAVIDNYCERPAERTLLIALSIQQLIEMSAKTIPPEIAAKLVMECAIPMSKIGPEWLA